MLECDNLDGNVAQFSGLQVMDLLKADIIHYLTRMTTFQIAKLNKSDNQTNRT